MYFTYVLECADGSLYTGWTINIDARLQAHNDGTGARYTLSHRPVKLAAYWTFATRKEAMSMEAKLKRLTRQQKLALVENRLSLDAIPSMNKLAPLILFTYRPASDSQRTKADLK